MKRNYKINIYLSEEEIKKIKNKAKMLGMSVNTFVRFVALRARVAIEQI